MALILPTSPSEEAVVIRSLLHANLLSVFNERNASARNEVIKNIYAEDVIWYEPDRVNQGQDALGKRAADLLAESPGFGFQFDGNMIVTQNLGVLNWKFGPAGDPELVKGVDIILVEGAKIKALWTALTKVPEQ